MTHRRALRPRDKNLEADTDRGEAPAIEFGGVSCRAFTVLVLFQELQTSLLGKDIPRYTRAVFALPNLRYVPARQLPSELAPKVACSHTLDMGGSFALSLLLVLVFWAAGPELLPVEIYLFNLVATTVHNIPVIFMELVFPPDVALVISIALIATKLREIVA
jgi:hypothetical protein